MTHDVFLCEIDKLNAVHVGHYSLSFDKSRTATGREIDLSYVASDHGLRSEAYPGEKHLHLFGSRVLRFVQNDERVSKRSPTHESEWRNFDHSLFEQPCNLLVIDQIEQRIIERAQVRINFVLQVTRQEAELLAGLNRRPRKHYSVHSFLH